MSGTESVRASRVIMFVDDQYLNRALFLRALSGGVLPKDCSVFEMMVNGTTLILVNNTAEALKIFKERQSSESSAPIDLVFMDRDFSFISPPLPEGQDPGGNGDWAILSIRDAEKILGRSPCYIHYNTADDLTVIPEEVKKSVDLLPDRTIACKPYFSGGYLSVLETALQSRVPPASAEATGLGGAGSGGADPVDSSSRSSMPRISPVPARCSLQFSLAHSMLSPSPSPSPSRSPSPSPFSPSVRA